MPGLMVLSEEKVVLDRLLKTLRGNDLLQIGGPSDVRFTGNARVSRLFFLDSHSLIENSKLFIQGSADSLPIQSEAIDIVLLIHQLECNDNPNHILEEAHRVLRPNGQLIIISFSPWSVWRLFYNLNHRNKLLKIKKLISAGKVKHELRKLNFDVTMHQTVCFRPPFKNKMFARYFLFLDFLGQFFLPYSGAVYIISATKDIPGMTPIVLNSWEKGVLTSLAESRTVGSSSRPHRYSELF